MQSSHMACIRGSSSLGKQTPLFVKKMICLEFEQGHSDASSIYPRCGRAVTDFKSYQLLNLYVPLTAL